MDNPPWMKKEIDELSAKYGTVPPPWILYDAHPCSICWRMGGGESHMDVFWTWWREEGKTRNEEQRIEYFRQFPPPARWLEWVIDAVWDPQTAEGSYSEDFDYSPYFARLEALGFGSQKDFERDFNTVSEVGSDEESDEDDNKQEEKK